MRSRPEDHNWIPHAYFESTTYEKFATLILYCPHCKSFRYQYGEPHRSAGRPIFVWHRV